MYCPHVCRNKQLDLHKSVHQAPNFAKIQISAKLCSIRKDNLMQNILFPLLFSTPFGTAVSCVGSCMSEYLESRLCEDILTDMFIFGLLNISLTFFVI